MKMLVPALALTLVAAPGVADFGDQRRGDQVAAFEARKAGLLQPLDKIVKKVSAQLPGWTYSGFEFEADSGGSAIYRLVYMRDGAVTWIYVDGRTGNTIGRK